VVEHALSKGVIAKSRAAETLAQRSPDSVIPARREPIIPAVLVLFTVFE
jgi:hypothetical protein